MERLAKLLGGVLSVPVLMAVLPACVLGSCASYDLIGQMALK